MVRRAPPDAAHLPRAGHFLDHQFTWALEQATMAYHGPFLSRHTPTHHTVKSQIYKLEVTILKPHTRTYTRTTHLYHTILPHKVALVLRVQHQRCRRTLKVVQHGQHLGQVLNDSLYARSQPTSKKTSISHSVHCLPD